MFMKGANGDVGAGARPAWRWNVVLSFADEQRAYVGWLAAVLKARAVRCFSTMPMSKPAVEEAPGRELPRTYLPGRWYSSPPITPWGLDAVGTAGVNPIRRFRR